MTEPAYDWTPLREAFEANATVKALGLKFDPMDPLHHDLAEVTRGAIRENERKAKEARRFKARHPRRAASLLNVRGRGRYAR